MKLFILQPVRKWIVCLAISLLVPLAALATATASIAATATPHWLMSEQAAPTSFHPGDEHDFYEIAAVNDGNAATSGPVTITDTLPAGVVVNIASTQTDVEGVFNTQEVPGQCQQATNNEVVTVTCTTEGVPVGRSLRVNINVTVPARVTPLEDLTNVARITGGGAPPVSEEASTPVTDSSFPIPFGASIQSEATDEAGGVDAQAGSHPFAFTTMLMFNVGAVNPFEVCNEASETPSCAILNTQAKDVEVALPPGLVGNPTAVPYCSPAQFEQETFYGCPAESQVGGLYLYFYGSGTASQYAPVYNIKPPPGQPAELGFTVSTLAHIPMFFHVRTDGDYGLTADVSNISQFDPVRMAFLSIWGNPADTAHNRLRLSVFGHCGVGEGGCASGIASPEPFLTMPTSCTADPLEILGSGVSWQKPDDFVTLGPPTFLLPMKGCEAVPFYPSISTAAGTHQAGAPTGYDVSLHVTQNEELEHLATSHVRDVEVSLPSGTTISPSAANGLSACSEEQFGLKVRAKGHCPSSSRIGSVKITTPLLESPVIGGVYVGEPECSPCSANDAANGRMVRVLIEAEADGVVIKQAGHTRINQATGQLRTVFIDTPQLPFSDLRLSLEPGPGAPLVNPTTCGPAVTTGLLTPWSGSTPVSAESEGISIEGCGSPEFNPTLQGGTTPTAHAGAFSDFTMTLSRADGEQTLGGLSVSTPPGLLGVLKNVQQCPEPQANAGTCGAGSLIGSGFIVVGPGSAPLTVPGSRVYLTGPYAEKPFGLSVVTPAQAGPFLLGGNTGHGTEVVRASIAVDPHTGALTVTSDPLPQQLNGVPLDIRTIHIDVNRNQFIFNPTNCNTLALSASVSSSSGTMANVSTPFQATDCGILPFKPRFTAVTQGKTSKKLGAALHVHVTSGNGQANIAKVKVDLPRALPSRLSTLQKACVAAVFDANPASCPAASNVGRATAVTPLLAKSLTGPAYLVSHGGAAFPDLEIVLQGEGITLILDGNTQIKKGITSSIFKAVPDAPINSFDLRLPEGPHSALAAFGSLCTGNLRMPTVITGQNGAVVKQTTKITATGCPRHKKQAGKKKA